MWFNRYTPEPPNPEGDHFITILAITIILGTVLCVLYFGQF